MFSPGSWRTQSTPNSTIDSPGRRNLRAIYYAGFALVALVLLLLTSGIWSPLRGASAALPAANTQAPAGTFTRMQALTNPQVDRPHHWNEPANPLQAPPIAPSDVITNNWDNVFPILYAIDTLTTTEAWAVGEYGHVVHYTGGAWTNVDPPSMRGLSLNDVKFLSPNDGYIPGGAKVFHYDGTNWNDMSNGLGSGLFVGRVFPLSDTNIWGVGTNCRGQCFDTVVHWDGTIWSAVGPHLHLLHLLHRHRHGEPH